MRLKLHPNSHRSYPSSSVRLMGNLCEFPRPTLGYGLPLRCASDLATRLKRSYVVRHPVQIRAEQPQLRSHIIVRLHATYSSDDRSIVTFERSTVNDQHIR
jgi:hypothetical protein